MTITIGTKNQIFETIGRDENFTPVLYFKIGKRKQALADLTNYFNRFHELLATGIELTDEEMKKFAEQFRQKAEQEAKEILKCCIIYQDRFFSYLPTQKRG